MLNKHSESLLCSLGSETLEQVEEYNYVGQVVGADSNQKNETRRRIEMGWGAHGKHTR